MINLIMMVIMAMMIMVLLYHPTLSQKILTIMIMIMTNNFDKTSFGKFDAILVPAKIWNGFAILMQLPDVSVESQRVL